MQQEDGSILIDDSKNEDAFSGDNPDGIATPDDIDEIMKKLAEE